MLDQYAIVPYMAQAERSLSKRRVSQMTAHSGTG